ncbi:outer membrane receptor for ferric coprogen and ferric-rhodotorulic acid [Pseudomonas nitritireducens]|uniref:Outer membrane receptor for ferric coprogen and ferric-rhodotorulic acid n=2 Tax=Pseudomonas nitroreducens TaxID=46680 RepID=A0A7W7KNP4_PSENT|nr:outer membrane receptor for ferric coprogen and ferric-rhodotorulic acid [Pseudomonas nitritireducens]
MSVSAALFKTEQRNVQEYAGLVDGHYVYKGVDNKSKGIELQASGEALPGLPQVKVGSRVSWQSGVESDTYSAVRQSAYALVDLMTRYDIGSNWSTSLNLNNLTDHKYLLSLESGSTSNYGAPRNLTASVTWKY